MKKLTRSKAIVLIFSIILIFVFSAGAFIPAQLLGETAFGATAAASYHFYGKPINAKSKLTLAGTAISAKKNGGGVLPGKRLVGYYASWAAYKGYRPDRIDSSMLTHINYAFANIGPDLKIAMGDPEVDPSNFILLNDLKKENPQLKTLISVGGWTWSGKFSDAALTNASRTAFAESCVDFMKKYGFDGVDIDWEYPVGGGLPGNSSRSADKQNFTLMLEALREALDKQGVEDNKHYLLTIAAGAGSSYTKNVELSSIHKYLDYATIMTYDLHGRWDSYTDLVAPLYNNTDVSPQYKSSVDSSITLWEKAAFPLDKLVMGVPFYGYKYSSVNNVNNGLYQTFSDASSINYSTIVKNHLNQNGFKRYFHSQSKVPWLFNGSAFITYEDPESIGIKADYIQSRKLGGAMIWELSQDPDKALLKVLYEKLK